MATVVPLVPAGAQTAPFDPNQIVFPVVGGEISFIDDFYQTRGGGRIHSATDIMTNGVKGLPVVAAFDGVVSWIGSTCCYLSIDHGGGYETWYIHLNNDTPGTDDGLGWGIAPGIQEGTPVSKGQLIGLRRRQRQCRMGRSPSPFRDQTGRRPHQPLPVSARGSPIDGTGRTDHSPLPSTASPTTTTRLTRPTSRSSMPRASRWVADHRSTAPTTP